MAVDRVIRHFNMYNLLKMKSFWISSQNNAHSGNRQLPLERRRPHPYCFA